MRIIQISFSIFLWITCASADALQCEANFGFFIATGCRINSGTVETGESINIPNADPKVLTLLSFDKVTLTTLPQNTFINFPLIEVFYVSHCELNRLMINDFKNGLKLKELFFYQTQLQVIPTQIFRLCPNIEKLTFSESPIQRIAKGAFSNLRKLKEIFVSNLNLVTFPSNMLANMTALEHITVENCSLKILPEGFFRNNRNLTRISLVTNQLESIPDGMFDHLENLDELRLDSNNLLTLSTSKAQKLFAPNNQLQQLHITSKTQTIMVQNNFITKVTCDNDLNVILAFFSNNSLSNLDCFRDMTKAINIILDDNKLTKLSAKAFNNLPVLRTLKINGNPNFKPTGNFFAPLTSLRDLWVDRLTTGYKNLRQQYPELSMLYLTTRSWNCSFLKQVANVLNTQRIYLRFINEYEDFVNFKCQLKMWDVSKFE